MAFNVTKKELNAANNINNDTLDIVKLFKKKLHDYLSNSNFPNEKAILSWMEKGGKLSSFTCRGDLIDRMMQAMNSQMIPYLLMREATGNYGFIIRECDAEKQRILVVKEILPNASKYCHIKTSAEAAKIYMQKGGKEKQMLEVCGLSEAEISYIEGKIDDVLPDETIGIDKMIDGTFVLTYSAPKSIAVSNNRTIMGLIAEAKMLTHGDVSKIVKEESLNESHYQMQKAKNFPDENGDMKKPVWIVGQEQLYVKRTPYGIQYGHPETMPDNEIDLVVDINIDQDDEAFEEKLNSCLASITKHKCLYSEEDVIEHFRNPKPRLNVVVVGTKNFITKATEIARRKLLYEPIMQKSGMWDSKFKLFQSYTAEAILAAQKGTVPKGYIKEDIVDLIKISRITGLDINVMAKMASILSRIEVYAKEAGIEKVTSIDEKIARSTEKVKEYEPKTVEKTQEKETEEKSEVTK